MITGKHAIAGEWSQSQAPTFSSINPRTKSAGDVIFADATDAEITRAVEMAAEAFKVTRDYPPARLAERDDCRYRSTLGHRRCTRAPRSHASGRPSMRADG